MRSYDNLAIMDDQYDGVGHGCNAVALGASHGGSYADIPTDGSTLALLFYNAETNGFAFDATIANPYVLNTSFSDLVKLTVVPIQADLDYLNANPEGLRRLWFGELIPELSFTKADIQGEPVWGNEGLAGGADLIPVDIPELFPNGTFDDNADGWTGSLQEYDGVGQRLKVYQGSFTNRPQSPHFILEAGVEYVFDADYDLGPNTVLYRQIRNVAENSIAASDLGTFTPDETTDYVATFNFGNQSEVLENYDYIDNISVKENITDVGITIQNYQESCRTTYENVNTGVSNLVCTQNAGGVLTGMAKANTAEFLNSGGATVNTNFKPNLANMTIIEVVNGEHRILKTDGTYKIDNVLQGSSPAMPNTNTYIELGNTAIIGDADIVDRTQCQFKVYSNLTSDAEDTAGWVQMQVTGGIGSTFGSQGWQILTVENGKTYQFSCDYDRAGVSPSISVKADSDTGISLLVFNPSANGWNNAAGQFTATSDTVAVHFGNGSDTALFDNVSIKQII